MSGDGKDSISTEEVLNSFSGDSGPVLFGRKQIRPRFLQHSLLRLPFSIPLFARTNAYLLLSQLIMTERLLICSIFNFIFTISPLLASIGALRSRSRKSTDAQKPAKPLALYQGVCGDAILIALALALIVGVGLKLPQSRMIIIARLTLFFQTSLEVHLFLSRSYLSSKILGRYFK